MYWLQRFQFKLWLVYYILPAVSPLKGHIYSRYFLCQIRHDVIIALPDFEVFPVLRGNVTDNLLGWPLLLSIKT